MLKIFDCESRAVSPVIGVILLVAITVILASTVFVAVIGLGLSESVCSMDFRPRFQVVFDQIFGEAC